MKLRHLLRLCTVLAVLLLVAAVTVYQLARRQRLQEYENVGANGVVQSFWLSIDGADQVLYARGYDRDAPLLLFLPGGPGESVVPLAEEFGAELERHFIVVHVESNGLGRSRELPQPPTFDTLVDITARMVDFLCRRYDRRGVYLVGHSFGSALALRVAAAHSDQVLGIATVGQTVDWPRGNELAMAQLKTLAQAEHNSEALRELDRLPATLTKHGEPDAIDFAAVAIQRKWLEHYALMNIPARHTARARWQAYITSPVHTLKQACGLIYRGPCKLIGDSPSWWARWKNSLPGIVGFRALSDVPRLEMPYIAIVGDDDWVTPVALIEQYYAGLQAPAKRLIRIPQAQHYAFMDNPAAFQTAVLQLLPMRAALDAQ